MPQAAPIAPESRRVVESKLMSLLGLGESGIQGGPLIWPRKRIHKTKAGSCKLSQPGAPSYSGGVIVSDTRGFPYLLEILTKNRDMQITRVSSTSMEARS